MADITMCHWEWCNKKDKCYRYTAKENPWRQAYFAETPIKEDWTCEYFNSNN